MTTIVDELWKRMIEKEQELDKVIDDYVRKGVIKVDGNNRELRHIEVLNIVDHIERIRNDMIRYSNQWREFKWMEEEKND